MPLLSLLPLGLESALVVDCGAEDTVALGECLHTIRHPLSLSIGIFGGSPIMKSWVETPLAGAALQK